MSAQAPSAVLLVRAEKFLPIHATAADNTFQSDVPEGQPGEMVSATALAEMDAVRQGHAAPQLVRLARSERLHRRGGRGAVCVAPPPDGGRRRGGARALSTAD
ncbi:hypothetical protein GCM10009844_20540 [Nocardioides koreensis]|uniref:Uncharacterized protein n=1 Tax=Nocardioides koreensis TaxID=433651 RepID=A0ABP5LGR5_9ACTN